MKRATAQQVNLHSSSIEPQHSGDSDKLLSSDQSHTAQAYQRLLRILPPGEESRTSSMLEIGLHSAVQIAGMAKPAFLKQWTMLYAGEEELGEIIYQNAVARRADVVLHHIRAVQDNEPHYRAARF